MGKWSKNERLQALLLAAAFVLSLLNMICGPEVGAYFSVGWMLIPPVWMMFCAEEEVRKKPDSRTGISVGLGTLACLFSCVLLWAAPEGMLVNWAQLLLPSLVVALVTGGILIVRSRGTGMGKRLMIAVVLLVVYAPGTAMCLNEMLPPRSIQAEAGMLVETESAYDRGHWTYFAVIEHGGAEGRYRVSRDDYQMLREGASVQVVRTRGLLGMEYLEIQVS